MHVHPLSVINLFACVPRKKKVSALFSIYFVWHISHSSEWNWLIRNKNCQVRKLAAAVFCFNIESLSFYNIQGTKEKRIQTLRK